MIECFIFFVMAGLIVAMLLCCSPFIMLCNGLKMSKYKANWLMNFPLINS